MAFLEKTLGFKPKELRFYRKAFIHRSLNKKDNEGNSVSYERLEFLGDVMLSAIISEYLFQEVPTGDEGYLTKMRSKIVSRKHLNELGKDHSRSLDFANCTGVPNRLDKHAISGKRATCTTILRSGMGKLGCRGAENVAQECHTGEYRGDRSVCGASLPQTKERWHFSTSVQSEATECFREIRTFQESIQWLQIEHWSKSAIFLWS